MNYIKQHKNKFFHQFLLVIVLSTQGLWLNHIRQDQITEDAIFKKDSLKKEMVQAQQKLTVPKNTQVVPITQEQTFDNRSDLNKQIYSDYTNNLQAWGIILTAVVTLMGIVLSYTQRGRFEKIDTKLEKNNEEHQSILKITNENYSSIIDELKQVKDINVRKDIITTFRDITNGYTRMAPDNKLKPFVDAEGERLITFAEEIMNEHFTTKVQDQALVKIDYTQSESKEEAKNLYGEQFQESFRKVSDVNNDRLKREIVKIASDEINNKYARFKNVCETFLHTHLLDIVKLSLRLKNK